MQRPALSEPSLQALFREAAERPAAPGEIAWYGARLPRGAGPVLDAMAGSGRMLVPLVDAGFHVHGAESSAVRLARCRARLEERGRTAELFRQDVIALNLPFRYAAAFIAGGAFQMLVDPAAALDALLRMRAHLVEPALLLLDLFVPAEAQHPPGAAVVEVSTVTAVEGCRIGLRSETSFDVELKRIDVVRRYERRERQVITAREDELVSFTWYAEEEAVGLLDAAGYRDIRIDAGPAAREDGRHFAVVARA
ncbi:MAG TPA: class I SAM-dependent methyltransferase [Casimicrobiaceae bacterium]|nr:class I SAM-dependent methyltransferase [Casimicrobiaceae bacterium]